MISIKFGLVLRHDSAIKRNWYFVYQMKENGEALSDKFDEEGPKFEEEGPRHLYDPGDMNT